MKLLQNRFVIIALRWTLAGVFIYAGVSKLGSPQNFSDSIATFAVLPNNLVNVVALGLPPFEIMTGMAVIIGIQRRPAILGLTALTIIFLIALICAVTRGNQVDCGCFGSGTPSALGAWIAVARDFLILAISLVLYIRELQDYSNGLESVNQRTNSEQR